jgi:hypothetical protein
MKKNYLCAIALSLGNLSFAQQLKNKTFTVSKLQPSIANGVTSSLGRSVNTNYKAPRDVLWSEDFTGGIPAGWTVVDKNEKEYLWKLNSDSINNRTSSPEGYTRTSAIKSTSGGNHMLLFSNEYNRELMANTNGSGVNMDSYFQTGAIPLNNLIGVSVSFQQKFRRCCRINPAPEIVLVVSKDATFATNFHEYDMINGVDANEESADPMNVSINISAIAANYTGNIYLRFHVKSVTSNYYWMIDDIQVVESETNDLITKIASANFNGIEYSRIPAAQIQPMSALIDYTNNGTAAQPNANLTVKIDDATSPIEFSSPNITIPSLAIDTIILKEFWTPPSTLNKEYKVTLTIKSDSTDVSPQNNTQTIESFTITEGIMALDDYSLTPKSREANSSPTKLTEYEVGNLFQCVANAPLYAIEAVTGSRTPVGNNIDAVLYHVGTSGNNLTYTKVWRSQLYQTTSADTNAAKKFFDVAGKPIYNMIAGNYYVAAVHSLVDYEYATSGRSPLGISNLIPKHSFVSYPNIYNPSPNSTFSLSETPMIRLDFKITPVGIAEGKATTHFSVYPNPNNGKFKINFTGEDKTAAISIRNIVGQTILNKTVNVAGRSTETISLADYSKGVYFLTVNEETVKLIIE